MLSTAGFDFSSLYYKREEDDKLAVSKRKKEMQNVFLEDPAFRVNGLKVNRDGSTNDD